MEASRDYVAFFHTGDQPTSTILFSSWAKAGSAENGVDARAAIRQRFGMNMYRNAVVDSVELLAKSDLGESYAHDGR